MKTSKRHRRWLAVTKYGSDVGYRCVCCGQVRRGDDFAPLPRGARVVGAVDMEQTP